MTTGEIVTCIILFVTAVIAIIQLILNRKVAKLDLDRRKKEATIAFTHEILELVSDLRQLITDEYNREPIKYSEYQSNDEMKQVITKYLNIMERISVGINSGVYDIDIYSRICGRTTIIYWDQLSHVIEEKRKDLHRDTLFIEYEQLVTKLKEMNKPIENHKGDLKERI